MRGTVIATLIALIAGFFSGYRLCHLRWETETERMNASQAQQETEHLEKAMEENRKLHEAVSQMQIRLKKENDDAKRKNDALLARINRGVIRVSVPANSCRDVSDAGRSGATDRKTRAELDPETVERILSVGRDGDVAIRDLNVCIDQYRTVAQMCGEKQQ